MTTDTESASPDEQEELRQSIVLRWWMFITALVIIFAGVSIVLIYGYLAKPGWIGVSGKKFWDYLELLVVPAVLAIGVYLLNRAQERERQAQEAHREREREHDAEQREREREATEEARRQREQKVANQRAQDAAMEAYITQIGGWVTEYSELYRREPQQERELAEAESKYGALIRNLAEVDSEYEALLTDVERMNNDYEKEIKQMPDERPTDLSPWGGRWVNKKLYRRSIENKKTEAEALRKRAESLREETEALRKRAENLREEAGSGQTGSVDEARSSVTRSVIRAHTLTALERVGAQHKRAIMRFLSEAKLLQAEVSPGKVRQGWIIELHDAKFGGADLTYMDLSATDLKEVDLSGANIRGANLSMADLSKANLVGANLSEASLIWANLPRANLSGANLSEGSLSQVLLSETNLSGANLSSANLRGSGLSKANFSGANISGADLTGANFSGTDLTGADLTGADLTQAQLDHTTGDKNTTLPSGLNPPTHWGVKPDEQIEGD
jgi:uncharacterized protein YjbI with pentapeptide repeats